MELKDRLNLTLYEVNFSGKVYSEQRNDEVSIDRVSP